MNKQLLLMLLTAAALAGCKPAADSAPAASAAASAAQGIPVPPRPDDLAPAPFPAELVQVRADTYQNTISYTPEKHHAVIYFDAAGKHSKKAVKGGFYREVLGKTAEGLVVVQDFYQNGKKPQTTPFALKADSDLTDFSNNNAEGMVIWFDTDGNLNHIALFENGTAVREAAYNDSHPERVSQFDAAAKQLRVAFYHPDGQTPVAVIVLKEDGSQDVVLFRADGTAAANLMMDKDKKPVSIQAWTADGKPAPATDPNTRTELQALLKQMGDIEQRINAGRAAAEAKP